MAEVKQEHTTHLLGAAVVGKTHPRIELRGRLDSRAIPRTRPRRRVAASERERIRSATLKIPTPRIPSS